MTGDERVRHCAECDLKVYNLTALNHAEIEQLVGSREGRLCVRLYKRRDGTMITRDCPVGFEIKVRRISRIAGAAMSAAMTAIPAGAQSQQSQHSGLVRVDDRLAGVQIDVKDWNGALVRNARIYLSSNALDFETDKPTDEYGRVEISNLAPGTYDVSVIAEDYGTPRKVLILTGGEIAHLEFQLDVRDMLQGGPMVGEEATVETIAVPISGRIAPVDVPAPLPPAQTWFKKLLKKLR